MTDFLVDVASEVERATKNHGRLNSCHEAYAVLKEEFDEFWDECKKKEPDMANMRRELLQIAAMAYRASFDLGLEYEHLKPDYLHS